MTIGGPDAPHGMPNEGTPARPDLEYMASLDPLLLDPSSARALIAYALSLEDEVRDAWAMAATWRAAR